MTDERKGATSASSAESDLLCPGRFLAQQGLPEMVSEDALSGTRIHAWLAGKEVDLSPDELENAKSCKRWADVIAFDWSQGKTIGEPIREERMWCAVGELEHSGQPDVVYVQSHRALILDYKTARSEVAEPNTNQQLRDLAVLASIRWPVTEVTVSIVQPFAQRSPPCVYDEKDLQRALRDMRNRVRQSNNPISPRIAGEKQCRYCRAKSICKEYSAWTRGALPLMATAGLDIQKPWTREQWAQFLTIAPEAEAWIEEKRQQAKRLLKDNPEAIPGFALEDSGTRQKITNVQAVFEQSTARGVTTEAFMRAVNVTKKGLTDALRGTGLEGQALKQTLAEVLFGNTEEKEIEPKIVKKPTL